MYCNGSSHLLFCKSLQCTLCRRGQPGYRSIPVQIWALTQCRLAYVLCYFFVFVLSVSLLVVYYFVCIRLFLFMNAVFRRLTSTWTFMYYYMLYFYLSGCLFFACVCVKAVSSFPLTVSCPHFLWDIYGLSYIAISSI